jgi:hypothetical protein
MAQHQLPESFLIAAARCFEKFWIAESPSDLGRIQHTTSLCWVSNS